jgi:hypothetical protein
MEKPWVWGLRERGGFKGFFWRCYVLKSKTVAMGGEMEKVLVGFWFRVGSGLYYMIIYLFLF